MLIRRHTVAFQSCSGPSLEVRTRDRPFVSGGDERSVLSEDTRCVLWLRRLPVGQSCCNLISGELDVERPFLDIDRDDVALAKSSNSAAHRRFRRNVADAEAACAAGEATVGHQSDRLAKTGPDQRA